MKGGRRKTPQPSQAGKRRWKKKSFQRPEGIAIVPKETEQSVEEKEEKKEEENEAPVPPCEDVADPYALKNSVVEEKAKAADSKWTNKQRTLVFSARGISHRQRHFLEDLRRLLPHSKTEPKWEKRAALSEINEACEMRSANNCVFLEPKRNGSELYLWLARSPMGPTVEFEVLNIHTLGELKMTGNCLLHSRPLLVFDRSFAVRPDLKVIRELIVQAIGTPRNHPKSKPFHDHVFSFLLFDEKIFFRHYQISPSSEMDPLCVHEAPVLTEIGPRFVLDPIRMLDESFAGDVIYENPSYVSRSTIRSLVARKAQSTYAVRKSQKKDNQMKVQKLIKSRKPGPLDPRNVFKTRKH